MTRLEEDSASAAASEREGFAKEVDALRAEASRGASLLEDAERRAGQLQALQGELGREYEAKLEEAKNEVAALLNEVCITLHTCGYMSSAESVTDTVL